MSNTANRVFVSTAEAEPTAEELHAWAARMNQLSPWVDPEGGHVCRSTTTPDGHGAYCAVCGETLA